MSFDPARLYSGLLLTGLQQKDNRLYQVIHDLIAATSGLNTATNTIISGGGGGSSVSLQGPQGPPGIVDSDNNSDSDFFRPNPSVQDLISNFTQGSVIFVGPSGALAQDNANLFWDETNKRLGIGTATPQNTFEVATGGVRIQGDVLGTLLGQGLELRFTAGNAGTIQAFNRATATWLPVTVQGSTLTLATQGTNQNVIVTPNGTGGLQILKIYGDTTAGGVLSLISTSGVGTTDKITFSVGNNGATLAMTINHDGSVSMSGTMGALNFEGSSSAGHIFTPGFIRAGGADSSAPAAGDIVANRGGNPGTGVVFFGGSANAHYLFYDGTNFNFVGGGLVVTGTISATTFSGALSTTSPITTTSYIRAGGVDSTSPSGGDLVANRGGNPGSGVVFFGGSANAHYLYYDGTNFNFVGAPILTLDGKLSVAGKLSTYNAIATTGWGVPAIYGTGRSLAQVAAVASVAAYTVGAVDGSFYVSANVNITTSTLHTFTVTCTYTDETNTSRVLTMTFSQLTGALVTAITNATGAGAYEGIPLHIRCKASTTITIATTGTFTTIVYNVEASITQMS